MTPFRRALLSISPEQWEVLHNPAHGKCNIISSQSIQINSVSNDFIPKIATDLKTTEMNEYRQTIIEKRNTEETQTDFPEICHSFSFVNVEEILLKVLRVEADLSTCVTSNANFWI